MLLINSDCLSATCLSAPPKVARSTDNKQIVEGAFTFLSVLGRNVCIWASSYWQTSVSGNLFFRGISSMFDPFLAKRYQKCLYKSFCELIQAPGQGSETFHIWRCQHRRIYKPPSKGARGPGCQMGFHMSSFQTVRLKATINDLNLSNSNS